jgi:hypothetical protein
VPGNDTRYGFVGLLRFLEKTKGGAPHQCTAELVAPTVAITAKHCVTYSGFLDTAQVVFGNPRRTVAAWEALPDGPIYSVRAVQKHSGEDVALLQLDRAVAGRTPAQLPPVEVGNAFKKTSAATLVGWGIIDYAGTPSAELRSAQHVVSGRSGRKVTTVPGRYEGATYVPTGQWGNHGDSGGALLGTGPDGRTYLHGIFVSAAPKRNLGGRNPIDTNTSVNIGATGGSGIRDWVTGTIDRLSRKPIPAASAESVRIKRAASPRPVGTVGRTFFTGHADVYYRSGAVRVTGSANGRKLVDVDDVLDIVVIHQDGSRRRMTHDFSSGCTGGSTPTILDLTPLLAPGNNSLVFTMRDSCGFDVGNTDVHLNADDSALTWFGGAAS